MKMGRKRSRLVSIMILTAALIAICAVASADGMGQWVKSRHGYVTFSAFAGDYDGWLDITGFGGVTAAEQSSVRIISKNASVWAQPRTNSKKLGTVQNGAELSGVSANTAEGVVSVLMNDGFYAVEYKGAIGWVNSAYAVCGPFEIVLMESNVPAYCAPDPSAKKVGSLSKLTRYTVLGFYEDYYVVNLRQAAAFIPMSVRHYDTHFERLYHAGYHAALTVTAKTALRTGPGDAYAKVKDLKAGETFDCIDEIEGWYLVSDGDAGGYTYIWSGDAQVNW